MNKFLKKWSLRQQVTVFAGFALGSFIAGFIVYSVILRNSEFYQQYFVYANLLYWVIAFTLYLIAIGVFVDNETKSLRKVVKLSKDIEQLADDLYQVNPINNDFALIEEALLSLNKNIRRTIAELHQRTYEVESLSKEAIKEMEYKKNLISSVTHEIKTPLAVIHATACALKDGVFEDTDAELDNIVYECENATEMLTNIISIYKMESEAFNLKLEEFSIIELLNDISTKFKTLIKKYKENLVVNFRNDIVVNGDKKLFEKVLNNVILNAIIYSPEGADIMINIVNTGANNVLEIINTGVNIPEDEIANIFDPFYRVDKSRTKSDDHGNGLGLYLVREVLTRHHLDYGEINIENGVKFYIVFPIE